MNTAAQLAALLDRAKSDPVNAQRLSAEGAKLARSLERALAREGEIAYPVQGFAALAPGASSPALPVDFKGSGWVTGVSVAVPSDGSVRAMHSLSLNAVWNGGKGFLATDGNAAQFIPFKDLTSDAAPIYRCFHRVDYQSTKWDVTARNADSGNTYTPTVLLWFVRDA